MNMSPTEESLFVALADQQSQLYVLTDAIKKQMMINDALGRRIDLLEKCNKTMRWLLQNHGEALSRLDQDV